jgi:penicillin amidase
MDADTMAMLEGYARGVNAWMTRNPQAFSSKLPPEYVILGYEPEPWSPAHTLTAIKMMSVSLAANLDEEAFRLGFYRMGFSEAEMLDLLPYVDADNPPPMPDLRTLLGLDSGEIGADVTTAAASRFGEVDGDARHRRLQQLGDFGRADRVGSAGRRQ